MSSSTLYRYWLTRVWDSNRPALSWIMLNPSTADSYSDDPTIRKCVGFAERSDYGGIYVVNLFAYCATSPKALRGASHDITGGRLNNDAIERAFDNDVVVAWGNIQTRPPEASSQIQKVIDLAKYNEKRLWCLGHTQAGAPYHPLYVPYHTLRVQWHPEYQRKRAQFRFSFDGVRAV